MRVYPLSVLSHSSFWKTIGYLISLQHLGCVNSRFAWLTVRSLRARSKHRFPGRRRSHAAQRDIAATVLQRLQLLQHGPCLGAPTARDTGSAVPWGAYRTLYRRFTSVPWGAYCTPNRGTMGRLPHSIPLLYRGTMGCPPHSIPRYHEVSTALDTAVPWGAYRTLYRGTLRCLPHSIPRYHGAPTALDTVVPWGAYRTLYRDTLGRLPHSILRCHGVPTAFDTAVPWISMRCLHFLISLSCLRLCSDSYTAADATERARMTLQDLTHFWKTCNISGKHTGQGRLLRGVKRNLVRRRVNLGCLESNRLCCGELDIFGSFRGK